MVISNKTETTSILIVEDELHNSRMLNGLIEKLRPEWIIEAIIDSVADTITWLTENKSPDLILMDIQLSDGICFSIFKEVELEPSTQIIFTTAYDEYAIRAFKVNSIDYLLKPINENELEDSFQKFEQLQSRYSSRQKFLSEEDRMKLINSILEGKKEYRNRFLISGINDYIKLDVTDIAYIYSSNKLTFAVDFNRKEYTLDYTLEQLETELDPIKFYRANRKIILNIDAVKKVTNESGGKLLVKTEPVVDFEITISRLKSSEFKNWMGK